MKKKIKKGDEVLVIAGSDKGRKGAVLSFNRSKGKLRVKGVRVQTCFDKKEGMHKKEGFIDRSNVKLIQSAPPPKKTKRRPAAAKL